MVLSGCYCSSSGGASSSGGGSTSGGKSSGTSSSHGRAIDIYYVGEVRNDPAAPYNRTAIPDSARPVNCDCPFNN
jgi:hypothetical protein